MLAMSIWTSYTRFNAFSPLLWKFNNIRSSSSLAHLFEQNKAWAARVTAQQPTFFQDLAKQQSPELLWIGCSDSRVPANQIIDSAPGEVFVHRNIANVIHATDFNLLAVLQFSVQVLKVK
jgi:carbonic anhydrase